MGDFILVLLKPPGDNMCLVDWSNILKDTRPHREEMLHRGTQMITQDSNVVHCFIPAF